MFDKGWYWMVIYTLLRPPTSYLHINKRPVSSALLSSLFVQMFDFVDVDLAYFSLLCFFPLMWQQ